MRKEEGIISVRVHLTCSMFSCSPAVIHPTACRKSASIYHHPWHPKSSLQLCHTYNLTAQSFCSLPLATGQHWSQPLNREVTVLHLSLFMLPHHAMIPFGMRERQLGHELSQMTVRSRTPEYETTSSEGFHIKWGHTNWSDQLVMSHVLSPTMCKFHTHSGWVHRHSNMIIHSQWSQLWLIPGLLLMTQYTPSLSPVLSSVGN
jgi:hypothetical protein